MNKSRKILILALIFPIVALLSLVAYKRYHQISGQEYTFPISGYDPRDIFSGHYLTFKVEYGVDGICEGEYFKIPRAAFVCLETKKFSYDLPEGCSQFIRGVCQFERFEAGVERFYVSEARARELEQHVINHNAQIKIAVMKNGSAIIKSLVVNGEEYREK